MIHTFKTSGTCSRNIKFELNDGVVKNVSFEGGCEGNQKGISALVEGKKAEDVIGALKGIRCGFKQTSCPDQLSKALSKALEEENDIQNQGGIK